MTNLPQPADPGPVWGRFSADPRVRPTVRASDADRDVAAEVLNAAYSDGRLDASEHADRLAAALGAKQLGQLAPLLDDITVSAAPRHPNRVTPHAQAPASARRGRRIHDGALRSWIGLAVLFNVIWVATWLFAGITPYYYWPIWPMIGTAIPVLVLWLVGSAAGDKHPRGIEGPDR